MNKKKIISLIIICVVVLAVIVGGIGYKTASDNKKLYDQAVSYLETDEYDNAIDIFRELGSYKNSADMVKETKYLQALNYSENKKYTEAIKMLEDLEEYSDSKKQIDIIKSNYAIHLIKTDIEKSFELLKEIEENSEITDQVKKTKEEIYINAKEALDKGSSYRAYYMFESLGDYKGSKEFLEEALLQKDIDYFNTAYSDGGYLRFSDKNNSTLLSGEELKKTLTGEWINRDWESDIVEFSANGVFKIYYLDVNKYASNNNIYTIKEDTLYRGSYSSVNEMLNKSSGYEIRKFNDSILIAFSKYNNKIESIYIKRDSEFGKRHLKGIEICEINDLNYEAPPIKKCEVCNGTGLVKFMHCESDLEAILSGYEPYTIQKCYKCDGEGK